MIMAQVAPGGVLTAHHHGDQGEGEEGGATTCGWQDAAATWAEYNCSLDPSHTPSWQQQTTSLVLSSFRESGAIFDVRYNNSI